MPGATLPTPPESKIMPIGGLARRRAASANIPLRSSAPLLSPPATPRPVSMLGATAAVGHIIPAVAPVGGLPPLQLIQDNALDRAFLSLLSREIPAIRRTAMVTANPFARFTMDDRASDYATMDIQPPLRGADTVDGLGNGIGTGNSRGIHAILVGAHPLTSEMKAEDDRRMKDEHIAALRTRLRQVDGESSEKIDGLEKQLRRADKSIAKRNVLIRRLTNENDELRQRLHDADDSDGSHSHKDGDATKSPRSRSRTSLSHHQDASDGFAQSGLPSPTSVPPSPRTAIATLPVVRKHRSSERSTSKHLARHRHRDTLVVDTDSSQGQPSPSATIQEGQVVGEQGQHSDDGGEAS